MTCPKCHSEHDTAIFPDCCPICGHNPEGRKFGFGVPHATAQVQPLNSAARDRFNPSFTTGIDRDRALRAQREAANRERSSWVR